MADINQSSSVASRVCLLQIHPTDNVAVALTPISAGHQEKIAGVTLTASKNVPLGAKLALQTINAGEQVIKFGEPIGSATEHISAGDHVHTHNLQSDYIPTSKHSNMP